MSKKIDVKNQFDRMKQLMNYGLNESKKTPYTGLEYSKVAADGKLYGIVREGTKYYIKVSPTKDNVIAENFEYIGGFRNRKDNEYSSFASAQKNFDFKMRSLQEAYGKGEKIIIESWNPDKNEELAVEATNKMRKEIMRERQIMENAARISENKAQECGTKCKGSDPFCLDVESEYKEAQKSNTRSEKPFNKGKKQDKDKTFSEKPNLKDTDLKEEVLGWNRDNDDYMDKSHGTEIGDSMPFDDAKGRDIDDENGTSTTGKLNNGTVEEGTVMHTSQNQNDPKPGVNKRGSDYPFDDEEGRQLDEDIEDIDGDVDFEDEDAIENDGFDGEEDDIEDDGIEGEGDGFEDKDDGIENDGFDDEDDSDSVDLEVETGDNNSIEDRLSNIEDQLARIADQLNVATFDDDDMLYDDEELEADDEDGADDVEFEVETGDNADFGDEEYGEDFDNEEDDDNVFESRSYRKMRLREGGMKPFSDRGRVPANNMNKLSDWGKHPAYQKTVMSLPPKDFNEFPGYYDMNDDSVRNDSPYGEKIGDGAPFEVDPDDITNAIAESIARFIKKKH